MSVTLRPYVDADLSLTLTLETDPVAMAELGGPRDRAALVRVHGTRIHEPYCLVIEADGVPVGTIGAWATDHEGAPIHETGWMVLPHAHRRGVATSALALLLDLLRDDPGILALHAFPGATNVASNRLCDRFGFADLGAVDVDFGPHLLHSRHRVLDRGTDPFGLTGAPPLAVG